jgi:uncharacterized protein YlzI (FlbEa/FlbD family)
MKFIKLEVLYSSVNDDETDSYKNVLKEIGVDSEEDAVFKTTYFNNENFKEEIFCIAARKDNPDNSVIEFFDGKSIIVNEKLENLILKLNDTETV